MKKNKYNITYGIFMLLIIMVFIIFNNLNDMVFILLAIAALIATSIFTYSNRK